MKPRMKLAKYIQILMNYDFNNILKEKQYIYSLVNKKTNDLNFILVFDIDYCLYYSKECREAEIKHNEKNEENLAKEWLANPLNAGKKPMKYKDLREAFGSVKKGICLFYEKSIQESMKYDFSDVERFIQRNEGLIEDLRNLEFPKFCFTNSFPYKARKNLNTLGIEYLFERVFCTLDDDSKDISQWTTKPEDEAFRFVQNYLGPDENTRIVFFDDSIENIKVAQKPEFNWITYHVTPDQDIRKCLEMFRKEYLKENTNYINELQVQNPASA